CTDCMLHLFFKLLRAHRDLHSFPTRRSSDLVLDNPGAWLVHFDRVEDLKSYARAMGPDQVMTALEHILAFHRRLSENVGVRPLVDVLFLDLAACGRRPAA